MSKSSGGTRVAGVTAETSLWSRANGGRSPRGRGRWAFSIGNKEGYNDISKAFFTSGTYTQAKRAAAKEAKRRGTSTIYVLP